MNNDNTELVNASIRNMEKRVWALASYLAKIQGKTMADYLKELILKDQKDQAH